MLASLLEGRSLQQVSGRALDPDRLPGTLDNYSLRVRLSA